MGERRATNKYYPPEWTPDQGSINTFVGQHPLRERAKKLDQGILVIRFEMPFDVWCEGCGNHIGKGVRYNAEKKAVGNYFSTKILNFRMKCHLCDNMMEIETDPKANDYICKVGVRRKVEEWEPTPEDHVAILASEEEKKKMIDDPMYRLENEVKDVAKKTEWVPRYQKIKERRDAFQKDDFATSYVIRKKFREEKKAIAGLEAEAKARGLGIPLLPQSAEDAALAKQVQFRRTPASAAENQLRKRLEIKSQSIFAAPPAAAKGAPALPVSHPSSLSSSESQQLKKRKVEMVAKSVALRVDPAHVPAPAPKPVFYVQPGSSL